MIIIALVVVVVVVVASCVTGSFAAPSWHGGADPDATHGQNYKPIIGIFRCPVLGPP